MLDWWNCFRYSLSSKFLFNLCARPLPWCLCCSCAPAPGAPFGHYPGMVLCWFYSLEGNGIWRDKGFLIQRALWPFLSSHSKCKASYWSKTQFASAGQWAWFGKKQARVLILGRHRLLSVPVRITSPVNTTLKLMQLIIQIGLWIVRTPIEKLLGPTQQFLYYKIPDAQSNKSQLWWERFSLTPKFLWHILLHILGDGKPFQNFKLDYNCLDFLRHLTHHTFWINFSVKLSMSFISGELDYIYYMLIHTYGIFYLVYTPLYVWLSLLK